LSRLFIGARGPMMHEGGNPPPAAFECVSMRRACSDSSRRARKVP